MKEKEEDEENIGGHFSVGKFSNPLLILLFLHSPPYILLLKRRMRRINPTV